MTDFSTLLQPDRGEPARLIHVVDKDNFTLWAKKQSPARQSMLEAIRFDAKSAFQFAILQGRKDGEFDVVTCVDKADALANPFREICQRPPCRSISKPVSFMALLSF